MILSVYQERTKVINHHHARIGQNATLTPSLRMITSITIPMRAPEIYVNMRNQMARYPQSDRPMKSAIRRSPAHIHVGISSEVSGSSFLERSLGSVKGKIKYQTKISLRRE